MLVLLENFIAINAFKFDYIFSFKKGLSLKKYVGITYECPRTVIQKLAES